VTILLINIYTSRTNKYVIVFTIMTNRKVTDNQRVRKEEVIDLTDIGHDNKMPVIRELDQDPVTGMVTMRSVTDPDKNSAFGANDSPVQFVEEDRGSAYHEPITPTDPDGNYEEQLEAEGAFIIDSTTYFPASKTTVTKKSQTPAEIAEKRGYHDFIER
jgi:hypothetical protein